MIDLSQPKESAEDLLRDWLREEIQSAAHKALFHVERSQEASDPLTRALHTELAEMHRKVVEWGRAWSEWLEEV